MSVPNFKAVSTIRIATIGYFTLRNFKIKKFSCIVSPFFGILYLLDTHRTWKDIDWREDFHHFENQLDQIIT